MDSQRYLQFNYLRRYGVEIEVNALDNKDHLPFGKTPKGIHVIGNIVSKTLSEYVEIRKWGPTHWNATNGYWVIKPDGSCGMEICSPISKGPLGLKNICLVVDSLKEKNIKADYRCSLHVHVEVADLTIDELATVVMYWIKCEAVFMDAFPDIRKNNRYCQFVGLSDSIQTDTVMTSEELINFFGIQKYTSINTFHLSNGKRPTIEFRIADSKFCLDSYLLKNWVRLVIHFVEMTKQLPKPIRYVAGDPWSSYLWLDPKDVFKVLGWDGSCELSLGMQQTKCWFISRLIDNIGRSDIPMQSLAGRRIAYKQVFELL